MRRLLLRAPLAACGLLAVTAIAAGVPQSAEEIRPLMIGAELPSAQVRALDGEAIDLRDAVGDRPALLIFYRGGW